MSCIRFVGGPVGSDGPPLRFSSPKSTWSKRKRLARMAVSPFVEFRRAAAGNPMTSEYDLQKLMFDEDSSVRGWVARNPKASENVVLWLSLKDPDPSIRAYAKYELQRREDVLDSSQST